MLQDNQTAVNPTGVNLLHTGAPPRTESTFVQGRLAGVPIKGPPSNIHPTDDDRDDDEKEMDKFFGEIESLTQQSTTSGSTSSVAKPLNPQLGNAAASTKVLLTGANPSGSVMNDEISPRGTGGGLGSFPTKSTPFGSGALGGNAIDNEFSLPGSGSRLGLLLAFC